MFNVFIKRFLRTVGGQVLAALITGTIAFLSGANYGPQFMAIAIVLGSALTALDKYLRATGVYGTSEL